MEPITTTPLDLDELHTAMERGDVAQISRLVADLYPAEIARLIESLPAEERRVIWAADPELLPTKRCRAWSSTMRCDWGARAGCSPLAT